MNLDFVAEFISDIISSDKPKTQAQLEDLISKHLPDYPQIDSMEREDRVKQIIMDKPGYQHLQ